MLFKEIIGQKVIKERLIKTVKENRVSHAQLFLGPDTCGKLALAIAYPQFISCSDKSKIEKKDSCGVCPSCIKYNKLIHPDLHFVYPVASTAKNVKPASKNFLNEWREFLSICNYYPRLNEWYIKIGIENKQGIINVRDCEEIIHTLSLKSYESEYKVMIIWMVEKLYHSAAPKILKILEEPQGKTLFILVSENQDQIINTILSRTQLVKIPKIEDDDLYRFLAEKHGGSQVGTQNAVRLANGSYQEAIRLIDKNEDEKYNFTKFAEWMRLCYKKDIIKLVDFSSVMSKIGRERQKSFFQYALRIIRQCILLNYSEKQLIRLEEKELQFVNNFAPFIHNVNGRQIAEELSKAMFHIERNANPSILFMDLSLKVHQHLNG